MTIVDDVLQCSSRLDLWAKLVGRMRSTSMLELGVWKGEFSAHILTQCPAIERYYMLDPWRPLPSWNKPLNVSAAEFEKALEAATDATSFAGDKVTILRGTAREVIGRIPDESLDFAYIDGDHTLRGISIDLINTYPKIKPGGFLGGDDFDRDIWQHGPDYEPTLVFPFAVYFAEAVGARIHGLPFGQFLIEKPLSSDDGYEFKDHARSYENIGMASHFVAVPRPAGNLRRVARKVRAIFRS